MPSRQQQTVAKRGDDRLARARAFRNPPTGAKRARKEKKLATSPRAVLKFVESLGLVAPPSYLLGPFRRLDFRCSSFRRTYEAPGAPEVPMDARKRKGLIGTKVRGERLRDPGARCVVQFFEKRPQSKSVRSPKIPKKDDPGHTDHFDRHSLEKNILRGHMWAPKLA